MADIQAFRGLRYDLGKVGSLSSVVAPPYDVIDSEHQSELYALNEHNVVRLILNRGDALMGDQTIYDRAAEHIKKWRRDGILKTDNVGTVYVYHQTFSYEGQEFTRRGFMSRVRIEPFGEGKIYPHEETHSKAKDMTCGFLPTQTRLPPQPTSWAPSQFMSLMGITDMKRPPTFETPPAKRMIWAQIIQSIMS